MRLIDAHVHTLDNYPSMAPFPDMGRLDRLLHLMDKCGVEKAVMLPVVADFSPNNNEECARWAREHADRLVALTNVQLEQDDAAVHITQARQEFDAAGISYYPPTPDLKWLLESRCDPIWEALQTHDLVCNLQVTAPNYATFLELARHHSQITFVANHLALPSTLPQGDADYGGFMAARDLPNIFVKASAFYAAAATSWDFRCPQALSCFARLVEGLGPDRILWGTDWPPCGNHITYHQALEIVRTCAGLDEESLTLILGENAVRAYKIG